MYGNSGSFPTCNCFVHAWVLLLLRCCFPTSYNLYQFAPQQWHACAGQAVYAYGGSTNEWPSWPPPAANAYAFCSADAAAYTYHEAFTTARSTQPHTWNGATLQGEPTLQQDPKTESALQQHTSEVPAEEETPTAKEFTAMPNNDASTATAEKVENRYRGLLRQGAENSSGSCDYSEQPANNFHISAQCQVHQENQTEHLPLVSGVDAAHTAPA